jgi:hypothetical protein
VIGQAEPLSGRLAEPGPGPARRRWFTLAICFAVVVVLATGVFLYSWFARQTQTRDQVYRHAVGELDITLSGGNIVVLPGAAGQVTVRRTLTWSAPKPEISETWTGRALRIKSGCWTWHLPGCSVDYVVRVPAGVAVKAVTGTGSVSVRDIAGRLSASSDAGSITATGLRSTRVVAGTRSGAVDLRFDHAPDRVDATSSSGDIGIWVPYPGTYSIRADARAGQRTVAVEQNSAAPRTITARADSGNVTVQYAGR